MCFAFWSKYRNSTFQTFLNVQDVHLKFLYWAALQHCPQGSDQKSQDSNCTQKNGQGLGYSHGCHLDFLLPSPRTPLSLCLVSKAEMWSSLARSSSDVGFFSFFGIALFLCCLSLGQALSWAFHLLDNTAAFAWQPEVVALSNKQGGKNKDCGSKRQQNLL